MSWTKVKVERVVLLRAQDRLDQAFLPMDGFDVSKPDKNSLFVSAARLVRNASERPIFNLVVQIQVMACRPVLWQRHIAVFNIRPWLRTH